MRSPAPPPVILFLYQGHERARKLMGRVPLPFLAWVDERVGITGYEVVTQWAQKGHLRP